ncbi:MAG: hypothetical protein Q8L34_02185 [Candidatus Woesearchaeota archaeon]|nr:hypothetical protein [Candidatus Woesearchaeota archaeon]
MGTLLEKIEKYYTFGGLLGTLVGGSILIGAIYLSSPHHYTPDTVRALRIRYDLQHERTTPGFLQDKPLNYFVQAQQEYNSLLEQPEVQSGIRQEDFASIFGVSGCGLALFSTAILFVGLLLQRQRLERLRADVTTYRLSEARDKEQFAERLLDPELQEPTPPRKYTLKKLD